jgi:hypothetical protein
VELVALLVQLVVRVAVLMVVLVAGWINGKMVCGNVASVLL